jgi:hypothetical protein
LFCAAVIAAIPFTPLAPMISPVHPEAYAGIPRPSWGTLALIEDADSLVAHLAKLMIGVARAPPLIYRA